MPARLAGLPCRPDLRRPDSRRPALRRRPAEAQALSVTSANGQQTQCSSLAVPSSVVTHISGAHLFRPFVRPLFADVLALMCWPSCSSSSVPNPLVPFCCGPPVPVICLAVTRPFAPRNPRLPAPHAPEPRNLPNRAISRTSKSLHSHAISPACDSAEPGTAAAYETPHSAAALCPPFVRPPPAASVRPPMSCRADLCPPLSAPVRSRPPLLSGTRIRQPRRVVPHPPGFALQHLPQPLPHRRRRRRRHRSAPLDQ